MKTCLGVWLEMDGKGGMLRGWEKRRRATASAPAGPWRCSPVRQGTSEAMRPATRLHQLADDRGDGHQPLKGHVVSDVRDDCRRQDSEGIPSPQGMRDAQTPAAERRGS